MDNSEIDKLLNRVLQSEIPEKTREKLQSTLNDFPKKMYKEKFIMKAISFTPIKKYALMASLVIALVSISIVALFSYQKKRKPVLATINDIKNKSICIAEGISEEEKLNQVMNELENCLNEQKIENNLTYIDIEIKRESTHKKSDTLFNTCNNLHVLVTVHNENTKTGALINQLRESCTICEKLQRFACVSYEITN